MYCADTKLIDILQISWAKQLQKYLRNSLTMAKVIKRQKIISHHFALFVAYLHCSIIGLGRRDSTKPE